jgi:hypothetical protein
MNLTAIILKNYLIENDIFIKTQLIALNKLLNTNYETYSDYLQYLENIEKQNIDNILNLDVTDIEKENLITIEKNKLKQNYNKLIFSQILYIKTQQIFNVFYMKIENNIIGLIFNNYNIIIKFKNSSYKSKKYKKIAKNIKKSISFL